MAPIYPLFPVRESGHLQVSPIHSIYYQDCGILTGVPVLYLHGGPGEGMYIFPAYVHIFFFPAVLTL